MAWCRDAEGSAQKREQALSAHLGYVETILDQVLVAGPLKNQQGDMVGSSYVYNTEDETVARRLLEADPYYRADVWEQVEMLHFDAAAGTWCGGVSWK